MRISKLFINRQVAEHPMTRSIQSRLKLTAKTVQNAQQVYEAVSSAPDPAGDPSLYLLRLSNSAYWQFLPHGLHLLCFADLFSPSHSSVFCKP
jgi:hypothetical protein